MPGRPFPAGRVDRPPATSSVAPVTWEAYGRAKPWPAHRHVDDHLPEIVRGSHPKPPPGPALDDDSDTMALPAPPERADGLLRRPRAAAQAAAAGRAGLPTAWRSRRACAY